MPFGWPACGKKNLKDTLGPCSKPLSIIAYQQPITRGEIEAIRGVGVSSPIIQTMLERSWIRSVGHKEVAWSP